MTDPATLASSHNNEDNEPKPSTNGIEIKREEPHDDVQPDNGASLLVAEITNGISSEHPDAPPAKRRKVVDGEKNHKSSPRAVSPPWKKVQAEGPTSFLENGKRRSGRTNAVPLELLPQTKTRQTRSARDKAAEKHKKPGYSETRKSKIEPPKHAKTPSIDQAAKKVPARLSKTASSSPMVKKEVNNKTAKASPRAQVQVSSKRRSGRIPTKSKREVAHQEDDAAERELESDSSGGLSEPPSPPLLLKKVSFRVRMPRPTVMTPANIPLPRKYATFEEFIEQDQTEDPGVRAPLTLEQIRKEAASRVRVQTTALPGRPSDSSLPSKQTEPNREYAHRDHLLAHIDYFSVLLRKERKAHIRDAEVLAHEAKRYVEEKQRKGRVKTAEELELEQRNMWIGRLKTVVKDIARLWQSVEAEVNASRLRQYEQEQQERIKGHLNRVLDRTDAMLMRQDTEISDSDVDGTDVDESEDDSIGDESEDSEQMSASGSTSDSSEEVEDPDATMTLEQLKQKYNDIPATRPASISHESEDYAINDEGEEDTDPETIMDSELETEEDSDDSDEDHDDDNDSNGNQDEGLLSLFTKQEREAMAPTNMQRDNSMEDGTDQPDEALSGSTEVQPVDNMDNGAVRKSSPLIEEIPEAMEIDSQEMTVAEVRYEDKDTPGQQSSVADTIEGYSTHPSPRTSATKIVEAESGSAIEQLDTPADPNSSITPIPPLLRGTLRVYQHEGLDWLAKLYAGGRSGILADEMGLGKTIQSIALLAHLATTYEVWGPHLIVVPTSVMLNWEMEFKKFLPGFKILTYYGSQEERKQKRRGWMADDSFNVCITSYQLVLQDANSFKRRKWHYMILDEAHNIKNFRSERWQTMMTFNTRARLLLTGTPLQNNLTELWSLLFFLHYGQDNEGEDDAFAGLREWSEWFKRPVESILEHGKQVLDQEDQAQVAKLHKVIRPFLLRRLKADVEKQMPLKYEHVEMCRLSKRQRQLYDGFMSRAQTRETLASGNYLSIINALMQLRKVCNHPDLFETRPINTSFAMARSVAAGFEILDLLVRRKLFNQDTMRGVDLDFLQLVPVSREDLSWVQWKETSMYNAYQPFKDVRHRQCLRVQGSSRIFATADRGEVMSSLESVARQARLQSIDRTMYYEAYKHHQHPVYGVGLLKKLDFNLKHKQLMRCALQQLDVRRWDKISVFNSTNLVQSLETRSRNMDPFVEQYACVTPAAVAIDLPVTVIGESRADVIRQQQGLQRYDPFHQARMKLSIAFPDKRLLQYDCGKLQRLDKLLRQLQAGGHRALIFTQMTKVLDILEQFLNIHGHRYLRLDGATKIEQRQILTDRFNNDTRILCFILSSRSGGLGINLTGADTVIFYDLDWNPAMDKQCTDRAHRIGQTRDVHIYRFVSEHTIESNILRKASQKQLLDDVVIQEGDFTTDYLNKLSYRDMLNDTNADADVEDENLAGAAMDRVLGGNMKNTSKADTTAFEQAEDKEDITAARVAAKEVQHADDGDFDDQPASTDAQITASKETALDPYNATNAAIEEVNENEISVSHIDDYLLRLQKYLFKDIPIALAMRDRSRKGRNKKGKDTRRR